MSLGRFFMHAWLLPRIFESCKNCLDFGIWPCATWRLVSDQVGCVKSMRFHKSLEEWLRALGLFAITYVGSNYFPSFYSLTSYKAKEGHIILMHFLPRTLACSGQYTPAE
jgi:hypothetical protein